MIPGTGGPRDQVRTGRQLAGDMPNGLPTGKSAEPRMPLITPAAEVYQATSAGANMRGRSTSVAVKGSSCPGVRKPSRGQTCVAASRAAGNGAKAAMAATGGRALSGQGAFLRLHMWLCGTTGKTCPEGNAGGNGWGDPVLPISEHDLHPVNRVYPRGAWLPASTWDRPARVAMTKSRSCAASRRSPAGDQSTAVPPDR